MSKEKINYLISESEYLIMEYLWNQEEGKTFGEIVTYLNDVCQKDWRKQTINTFIKRLKDKGLINTQNNIKRRIYYPSLSYVEYKQGKAKELINELYGGSMYTFLSAFSGDQKLDENTANELRKILEEL